MSALCAFRAARSRLTPRSVPRVHLPQPPSQQLQWPHAICAVAAAPAAAAPCTLSVRRSLHACASLSSITGISFQPMSPAELKVVQWLKQQEIAARRKALHVVVHRAWATVPREDWSRLDPERSEVLLRSVQPPGSDPPSEWEVTEFMQYTLKQKCPWRFEELVRERKALFEETLAAVMKDLRKESEAYKYGTMLMTKNELTRKLTAKLGGKLPSAAEVDMAWQDRHQLPAIEWVEDAI